MLNSPSRNDAGAAWRNQPAETSGIHFERLVGRRALQLSLTTRSDILGNVIAAPFFAAIISWKLSELYRQLALLTLPAAIVWSCASAYWFRRRIS